MRNFLTNLNIVACVNCWEEGKALSHCLGSLIQVVDYVAIMLDHPSEETVEVVNRYKNLYPDIVRVGYTTAPALKNPNNVRRREKVYRSNLVEDKLALVKKIHREERPIDILLSPDSDEMFNISLPQILTDFWQSDKTCVFMKSMDVYSDFYLLHNKGLMSHCRAYKYKDEVNFTPRRYQDFYNPYRKRDSMFVDGGYIHLSQHADFRKLKAIVGDARVIDSHPKAKFWKLDKPAWELTPAEYQLVIARQPDYIAQKDYQYLNSLS
jgi:hypothetical protein